MLLSGDSSSEHSPCHDHSAGNGSSATFPSHSAAVTQCGGEGTDPAAHTGDQCWVKKIEL